MNNIRVTCKGSGFAKIDELINLQGELKLLSQNNLEKLKKSIIKYGFSAPVFVWQNEDKKYILDGVQRLRALDALIEEGWNIKNVPIVDIDAKDINEAKEKLLHITSQYGAIDINELDLFISNLDLSNIDTVNLVGNKEIKLEHDINIDIDDLIKDHSKGLQCPRCGYKW